RSRHRDADLGHAHGSQDSTDQDLRPMRRRARAQAAGVAGRLEGLPPAHARGAASVSEEQCQSLFQSLSSFSSSSARYPSIGYDSARRAPPASGSNNYVRKAMATLRLPSSRNLPPPGLPSA